MFSNNYAENICLTAPGLAINAAGSSTVKYANTFQFKANSRISTSITTAIATSIANAVLGSPFPNGVAATPPVLATGYGRIYALIATLPFNGTATAAPTFSWLASADFVSTADLVNAGLYPQPSQNNQTVVGYVCILNNSGSAFTPGTTALDASGLTTTYQDNFKVSGL